MTTSQGHLHAQKDTRVDLSAGESIHNRQARITCRPDLCSIEPYYLYWHGRVVGKVPTLSEGRKWWDRVLQK